QQLGLSGGVARRDAHRSLLHAAADPGPPGRRTRHQPSPHCHALQHPRTRGPHLGQLPASRVHDHRGPRTLPDRHARGRAGGPGDLPRSGMGDIVLRPPTVTFAGRLTLWVDALRLEATYLGPAHTTREAILWIREGGGLL